MSEPPTATAGPAGVSARTNRRRTTSRTNRRRTSPLQNYPPQNYPPQNYPPLAYPQTSALPLESEQRLIRCSRTTGQSRVKPSEEFRRDSEAALAARMELGPEYTEYVAAGLAERVEDLAETRAAELAAAGGAGQSVSRQPSRADGHARLALAIVSIVIGHPDHRNQPPRNVDPSILGVAVSWAGIVGVNWVHATSPPQA